MDTSHLQKENDGRFNISRRVFLKLTTFVCAAAAGIYGFIRPAGLATFAARKRVPKDVEERWVVTSCLNCPASCATRVKVASGKAVSIRGNALSRAAEGKTCPRAPIGLQVLYDPDRLKSPLKRTNQEKGKTIDPRWVPISWDQALQEISARLKSLRGGAQPHKLLLLHGLNTASDKEMIGRFAEAYGTPNVISGNGLESEAEKAGRWMADGHYDHIAYDLGHTNYVLAFGASILESQKPLSRNLRMWGKIRRERPMRAKVVVIDPRYSVTATKADEWFPIHPGTDGALAMAIANVILTEGLYDVNFIRNWTTGLSQYKELVQRHYRPEKVAGITGIPAEVIHRIAREFAQTKPAIAWAGTGTTRWPHGSYSGYAIFCLNALVGSIDSPGGILYQEYPAYREIPKPVEDRIAKEGKERPTLDLRQTVRFPAAEVVTNQVPDSILKNHPYPIQVAIGFNNNFSMSAPGAWLWDKALQKIPYYVHIAPFPTETAAYADLLLPASTFLEEWAYDHCLPGSGFAEATIKQPVVEPLYDSRSIVDTVFELARRLGGTVAQSFANLGGDAKGFVRYRTETLMPWKEFCTKGIWIGPAYQYYKYKHLFKTPSQKFEFYSGNLERLQGKEKEPGDKLTYMPHHQGVQFFGEEGKYPLILLTYQPLCGMENGSQNYPWAQEIFLVMHGMGWTNFAEVNSETAQALGFKDGDLVWVESPFNKIRVRAKVSEGIHPQVVGIARGQGHHFCGRWAKGMGVNPNEIIGVDYDRISGQAIFFNTRVKVYKA